MYVSTTGNDSETGTKSSPKATIKSALTIVKNGGTIYINSGRYNESKIFIDKNVSIIGTSTHSTVINAQQKHLFTIDNNVTVKLSKITIIYAVDTNGGAIYNRGTLKISYVKLEACKATNNGGAIFNKGNLELTKTALVNNHAINGGAIYSTNHANFIRCEFSKNIATNIGGAIYSSGKINVYNSNFTKNNKTAIYINGGKTSFIYSSNFKTNFGINGGSIFNDYSKLSINKTSFQSNKASQYGGSIYNKGVLSIKYSSFKSNTATKGGVITNRNYTYLYGNSFKNNVASNEGGVIYNNNQLITKVSKFTSNSAKYGGAIFSSITIIKNIQIISTQFSSNTATKGGAIFANRLTKLTIEKSLFSGNKNNAIYLKTINTTNTIYNSSFYKNNATIGGAINNQQSTLRINKTIFSNNWASSSGGAIYNQKGKTTIIYSILRNNDKIDLYNKEGKIIANHNWWCSNNKPSSSRQLNSTLNDWIYLQLIVYNGKVNKTINTTLSLNYLYNGTTITSSNVMNYIPYLQFQLSILGGGINKTFSAYTTGNYLVSNKYTQYGTVKVTGYLYNQKLKKTFIVSSNTISSKITALFVRMNSSVSSSTVNNWVNSGITDVYVQSKASTSNTTKLKQIISLTKNTNIRVHAWVICFLTDKGFNLSTTQQNMIKNFISKVIKIEGVDGVCLDYVRYSGTDTSIVNSKTITNFVKSVNTIVKGYNSNLLVSLCVFAEMSATKTYYGQDYAALSPYVDIMLPMAYKYDYNANRTWLQQVTKYVVNQAKYSMVVTLLQTYKETSSGYTKLSASELVGDSKVVINAGSYGYGLFRYGLISSYPTAAAKLS